MGILDTIRNPQDLSKLSGAQLDQLAAEVREFLIGNVSQTDERGAIGSLTQSHEPWIEDVLASARPQAEPNSGN